MWLWAMGCLLWLIWRKFTALQQHHIKESPPIELHHHVPAVHQWISWLSLIPVISSLVWEQQVGEALKWMDGHWQHGHSIIWGLVCQKQIHDTYSVFYLKFFEHPSFGQVAHEIYPSEWEVQSSEITITIMYCWHMFLMAVATDLTHVTILIQYVAAWVLF